jgi:ribosome-associated protein
MLPVNADELHLVLASAGQEISLKHMITRTRPRRSPEPERASPLQDVVTAALDDMKAVNVKVLDVRGLTDIADTMVIASGNSDRHVRSIADRVVERAKAAGWRPLGTEGERDGEWVLVDLQDLILHVMLPRVREFYGLEGLWDNGDVPPVSSSARAPTAVVATTRKPRAVAKRRRTLS